MESPKRQRIVAGNWKLHGDRAFAHALLDALIAQPAPRGVELVILPPLPYLGELAAHYSTLAFGAQDVSSNVQGAYTGEVCASMLIDVGLRPILCVGESLKQRDGGQTQYCIERQLEPLFKLGGVEAFANAVIAYE